MTFGFFMNENGKASEADAFLKKKGSKIYPSLNRSPVCLQPTKRAKD